MKQYAEQLTEKIIQQLGNGDIVLIEIAHLPDGVSWSDVAQTCMSVAEQVKKKHKRQIIVMPVPIGTQAAILRTQPHDIVAIQMKELDERIIRSVLENISKTIDASGQKGRLGVVIINNDIGLDSIALMEEEHLARLGLVKIERLVKECGVTEEQLAKIGLEPDYPLPMVTAGIAPEDSIDNTVKKKYIIHPSGDIGAQQLANLYGVELLECIVDNGRVMSMLGINQADYIHLYPRLDGNYALPTRKGR